MKSKFEKQEDLPYLQTRISRIKLTVVSEKLIEEFYLMYIVWELVENTTNRISRMAIQPTNRIMELR